MYGALIMFEDEFIHIVAISFTSLVLTELIMVALTIRTWHYIMVLAELLSLGLYILSLVVLKDYFGESQMECGSNTTRRHLPKPSISYLKLFIFMDTVSPHCDVSLGR
jgi:hypothetical protein